MVDKENIESAMRSAVEHIASLLNTDHKAVSLSYKGEWMDGKEGDPPMPIRISCELFVPPKDNRHVPYYWVCRGHGGSIDEAVLELISNIDYYVEHESMEIIKKGIELLKPYPRRG